MAKLFQKEKEFIEKFSKHKLFLEIFFKISNNYNSKIKNLAIDLKTTLVCGDGQNPNDANTGIKIGTQVGRCLFESVYS